MTRQIVHAGQMRLGSSRSHVQEGTDMAKGQMRSNREKKKPKQDKSKKIVSSSPFAAAHTNPGAKAAANKHK